MQNESSGDKHLFRTFPPVVNGGQPGAFCPRPGIAHIMLLTGFCAALLVLQQSSVPAELPEPVKLLRAITNSIHSISTALCMTAFLAIVWQRVRYQSSLIAHPGYWLVFTLLSTHLIFITLGASAKWLDPNYQVFPLLYAAAMFPGLGIQMLGAVFSKPLPWKLVMAVGVFVYGWQALEQLLVFLQWFSVFRWASAGIVFGKGIMLLLMVAAVVHDLLRKELRDWLHWTGVLAVLLSVLGSFVWIIGMQFSQ